MGNLDTEQALQRLTEAVLATGVDNLHLIGIRTGGEPLAKALRERIKAKTGYLAPLGLVDITLYRDDLDHPQGLKQPEIRATEIPFPIDGKRILMVDDVFFTGRTVRAALDAICDLGRPAKIELLVLVDRGFHELPIRPDFVGAQIETNRADRVEINFDSHNGWSVEIRHGVQS